jgi:copper(I)-binding protein
MRASKTIMRAFKTIMRGVFLGAALLAAGAAAGDLQIASPWSRATAKGAPVGAGYLTIVNKGAAPDRLVSVATKAAASVEIHAMSMDNGVMTMRALPDGLEIKPGETVTFKPGGYHLMLMGLAKPLVQGENIELTLTFAKAGPMSVTFPVGAVGATAPAASEESPSISY